MRKILAKRLLGACGSARTSWTGSTILIFFTAYKYLCKTLGQAPCPSPLGAPLGAHPSPALPGGAGQGGSHAAPHLERVFRARLVKYLRAHGLCCRLPRNPPVNSCHSSAPSPELPRPPPCGGCALKSLLMGAQRGARAEGINPEQAPFGPARFSVPPNPTDAPGPGHALAAPRVPVPWHACGAEGHGCFFPCRTRLLSPGGKSAASAEVLFPFSHPRGGPGRPWAEFLGKRRSTRGSRPGRAPAPSAGSLAATRLDPGAPRSFLALLPSSTVINLPFPVEATRTQTGAGWKSRWPPRDARPAGHGGGFGDSGRGCEALPARAHPSLRGFAEPQEPPWPSPGSQSRNAARHPWSQGHASVRTGACPGHAVPGAPGALSPPQPRSSPSCSGLKRAGETGPVPGGGTATARPCPLREGVPLVSGMAARPSPHASQPAAGTPRHRPFQIRSLSLFFFFSPPPSFRAFFLF